MGFLPCASTKSCELSRRRYVKYVNLLQYKSNSLLPEKSSRQGRRGEFAKVLWDYSPAPLQNPVSYLGVYILEMDLFCSFQILPIPPTASPDYPKAVIRGGESPTLSELSRRSNVKKVDFCDEYQIPLFAEISSLVGAQGYIR